MPFMIPKKKNSSPAVNLELKISFIPTEESNNDIAIVTVALYFYELSFAQLLMNTLSSLFSASPFFSMFNSIFSLLLLLLSLSLCVISFFLSLSVCVFFFLVCYTSTPLLLTPTDG
mmetsp:Transcript_17925/g.21986  ORF Transcript_17925/g.21986 Transcript_17925/m.21986 type:complete len:116 (+) Transcript_17925:118-465(+)